MAGLDDLMARSSAAGAMAGGMGGEMPPEMMPPPTEEEPAPGTGSPDVEEGLGLVEAFADSVDPATGDQIREACNKIRELAATAAPTDQEGPAPEETAALAAEPPPEAGGMPM